MRRPVSLYVGIALIVSGFGGLALIGVAPRLGILGQGAGLSFERPGGIGCPGGLEGRRGYEGRRGKDGRGRRDGRRGFGLRRGWRDRPYGSDTSTRTPGRRSPAQGWRVPGLGL